MRFGPVPVDEADGKILAHNVADGKGHPLLRKGTWLTTADIEVLRELGKTHVFVANLEPSDVHEEQAAHRIAEAVAGPGVNFDGPSVGRVNLITGRSGLLSIDRERLAAVNRERGVAVATLTGGSVVTNGQTVATVKVIPFGVPDERLRIVEAIAAEGPPIVRLEPFLEKKVAIVLYGPRRVRQGLIRSFVEPLSDRVDSWGAHVDRVEYVEMEVDGYDLALGATLEVAVAAGSHLVLTAGETAIMDWDDVVPAIVRSCGGQVECIGAPVDPGSLLMLAYLDGIPVVGVPGCARSRRENVIDRIVPRLLVGQRLNREDIARLGHGGLLTDTRPRLNG